MLCSGRMCPYLQVCWKWIWAYTVCESVWVPLARKHVCVHVSSLTSSCPLQWAVYMTQLSVPWLCATGCPVPKSEPTVMNANLYVYAGCTHSKLAHRPAGCTQSCARSDCSPLISGMPNQTHAWVWLELGGRRRQTGMYITVLMTSKAAAGNTNANTHIWAVTVQIQPYHTSIHTSWTQLMLMQNIQPLQRFIT